MGIEQSPGGSEKRAKHPEHAEHAGPVGREDKGTSDRELEDLAHILGAFDEGKRRRLEKITQESSVDELTGLSTRRAFEARVGGYLEDVYNRGHERRDQTRSVGLIFMDLDHFKKINDTFGHVAGDEVLKSCAKTITDRVRTNMNDIACRWGGEEVVIALHNATLEQARAKAEELREAISNSEFNFPGHATCRVTGSFGVAVAERSGARRSLDELVKKADEAMYASKSAGRNTVSVSVESGADDGKDRHL